MLQEGLRRFGRLLKVWADSAYQGELVTLVREMFDVDLEIVKRQPEQTGFVVQAKRWIVERSLGWYSRNRRLSKDYEHLSEVSEVMVYIASIQVMLNRLRPRAYAEKPYSRRLHPRAA